jgi:hypothetical protein
VHTNLVGTVLVVSETIEDIEEMGVNNHESLV